MPFRATVRLDFSNGSGGGTNTWHMRDSADIGDEADLQALTEAIRDFYTALAANFCSDYVFDFDGQFTEVGTEDPHLTVYPDLAWTVNGTGGGNHLDSQAMVVVGWKSSIATRSGRGRTFLGPVRRDLVEDSNGTIAPAALAAIREAAGDLVDLSTGSLNGAIGVWSPTENTFRDVVGAAVRDRFAHLSSRRD